MIRGRRGRRGRDCSRWRSRAGVPVRRWQRQEEEGILLPDRIVSSRPQTPSFLLGGSQKTVSPPGTLPAHRTRS
ncbi:hypothetical protein GUJ93_ZPchr0406g33338 [Zizania palustris]|uniref:Uncharacterized protein n=1 Tax=Zizania palustris TaxID=103762 RepID=A0A8J5R6I7_ZIZPA|nr:hypothetical protein GUJ93_ZPchr0406g33338 [Zizania palustris]